MKKTELKTKRLTLRPMADAQIEALIARVDSDELRAAYGEMLDGCKRDPGNRIWYAPWEMTLQGSLEFVGDLCFKGPARNHAVEIGYGIGPAYEGRGYTTEALQAMTRWAFEQKDVIFVEAETAPDNRASQRVLEKCGFVPDGTGVEGPRFVLERPCTTWSPIYMLFGIAMGMSIGQLYGQLLWGMVIGSGLGALAGVLLDSCAKKSREAIRQQRKPRA